MTTQYGVFEITLKKEEFANPTLFKHTYGDYSNPYRADAYCINVKQRNKELSSAMLCGGTVALSPTGNTFAINDNVLFVCYGNEVYALSLPELQIAWQKQLDLATCFGVYPFHDDFIIHGEVDITRIGADGTNKWQFSGADIFVNLDGELAFDIVGEEIKLVDFNGTRYTLNGNGEALQ